MQQTKGATAAIMNQKQSDLVTSVTTGQTNTNLNSNKSKNNNNNNSNNINNNNSSSNNKNNNSNQTNINLSGNNNHSNSNSNSNSVVSGSDSVNSVVVVTNVQPKQVNGTNGKAQAPTAAPDARAKQVLKEAVDAVVNSFAKHTQGYGRGKYAMKYKLFN